MDRYEYKLKLDEMKAKLAEDKMDEAIAVADSINWRKVKTVSALCLAGEVYEKAERYEDSKDVLQQAYEYSPIGRSIIFRLAQVCMKAGEYEAAMDYYQEFVEIAPNDNMRYILKYKIFKAKGASVAELISILEEYKEKESSERWFFELAVLYHKAGMAAKCVEACDELILWFGDGKYVEKALELKMIYQPLTPAQEKTYRKVKQQRTGLVEVGPEDDLRSGEILNEKKIIPEVQIPAPAFNTVNLQKELAENMQQIIQATEKAEVKDTMDNIKKLVHDIPYLQIPQDEKSDEEKYGHIETDEEIDGSLKIDFQELLAEDSSGQMSLNVPDQPTYEQQITGQMSIEEVLREWEKTRNAAEQALKAAEQRKLEADKARALQEAEDIMERLQAVIPQLEAGVTPQELMEQNYLRNMEADMEDGIEVDIEAPAQQEPDVDEVELPEIDIQGMVAETEPEPVMEEVPEAPVVQEIIEEEPMEAVVEESEEVIEASAEQVQEEVLPEIQVPWDEIEEEKTSEIVAAATRRMPSEEEIQSAVNAKPKSVVDRIQEGEETPVVEEDLTEKNLDRQMQRITFLKPEIKEMFSYFIPVAGMEKQICEAMDGILNREEPNGSKRGNLLIEGGRGSGKSALAMNVIKAVQSEQNRNRSQVGKISAAALNKKDMIPLINKVAGGYLLIEKAGDMTKETAEKLALALESNTRGLVVIMEDTNAELNRAMSLSPKLAEKFTEKISIPVFTSDELVTFAKSYAKENGYVIDEMAILALYNRISGIQKVDRATYIVEVKEIMDGAMDKAQRGGLKRAFMKKHDDDGMMIIYEQDFE